MPAHERKRHPRRRSRDRTRSGCAAGPSARTACSLRTVGNLGTATIVPPRWPHSSTSSSSASFRRPAATTALPAPRRPRSHVRCRWMPVTTAMERRSDAIAIACAHSARIHVDRVLLAPSPNSPVGGCLHRLPSPGRRAVQSYRLREPCRGAHRHHRCHRQCRHQRDRSPRRGSDRHLGARPRPAAAEMAGTQDPVGAGGRHARRPGPAPARRRRAGPSGVAVPAHPRPGRHLAIERRGQHPGLRRGGRGGRANARVRLLGGGVLARPEGSTGRRELADARLAHRRIHPGEGLRRAGPRHL
ncbi:MAG: hypothetical protein QOI36_3625 [Pseudonocardiales bacterium]|nr:hypothetical protein [Pseudonocardiales bacterium]